MDTLDQFFERQRRRVRYSLTRAEQRIGERRNDISNYQLEVRQAPGTSVHANGRQHKQDQSYHDNR